MSHFPYAVTDPTGTLRRGLLSGAVFAVFADESLTFAAADLGAVEVIDQPGGQAADVDGARVTLHETGWHALRLHAGDSGASSDATVLVCEAACLSLLPERQRDGGQPEINKRVMLTTLARHAPWFDGTAQSLVGQSLAPYGA